MEKRKKRKESKRKENTMDEEVQVLLRRWYEFPREIEEEKEKKMKCRREETFPQQRCIVDVI